MDRLGDGRGLHLGVEKGDEWKSVSVAQNTTLSCGASHRVMTYVRRSVARLGVPFRAAIVVLSRTIVGAEQ